MSKTLKTQFPGNTRRNERRVNNGIYTSLLRLPVKTEVDEKDLHLVVDGELYPRLLQVLLEKTSRNHRPFRFTQLRDASLYDVLVALCASYEYHTFRSLQQDANVYEKTYASRLGDFTFMSKVYEFLNMCDSLWGARFAGPTFKRHVNLKLREGEEFDPTYYVSLGKEGTQKLDSKNISLLIKAARFYTDHVAQVGVKYSSKDNTGDPANAYFISDGLVSTSQEFNDFVTLLLELKTVFNNFNFDIVKEAHEYSVNESFAYQSMLRNQVHTFKKLPMRKETEEQKRARVKEVKEKLERRKQLEKERLELGDEVSFMVKTTNKEYKKMKTKGKRVKA